MTEGNFVDYVKINVSSGKGGKGSTQEEFFYTFNDLINQGKQIIISSNKSQKMYYI